MATSEAMTDRDTPATAAVKLRDWITARLDEAGDIDTAPLEWLVEATDPAIEAEATASAGGRSTEGAADSTVPQEAERLAPAAALDVAIERHRVDAPDSGIREHCDASCAADIAARLAKTTGSDDPVASEGSGE